MELTDFTIPSYTAPKPEYTQPELNAPLSEWQKYWAFKAKRTPLVKQGAKALGVDNSDIKTMQDNTPKPEAQDGYDYPDRGKEYISAIEALLAQSKPELDPEKEKRYKQRAAVNAIGGGLKAIFTGVQANNGYNVQKDDNKTSQESTDAYGKLLEDQKAKLKAYNDMLLNSKVHALGIKKQADETADHMRSAYKIAQERNEVDRERVKALQAASNNKSKALTYEERKALDDNKYDRMIEAQNIRNSGMRQLEGMKQSGRITIAEYNRETDRINEEYKLNIGQDTETIDENGDKTIKKERKVVTNPAVAPTTTPAPAKKTDTKKPPAKKNKWSGNIIND